MKYVVGLTGGIGCGKTSVANIFADLGAGIVDTDEIAHRLTRPGAPALVAVQAKLGEQFFMADGSLDRASLRRKVFSDAAAKKELEAILHPMIREQARLDIESNLATYVVLVVPLLFETNAYAALMQRTLVVDCSEAQQVERVKARSGMSVEEAHAIIAAQAPRAFRLARANDVIDNDGAIALLRERVSRLHAKYVALADAFSNSGKIS